MKRKIILFQPCLRKFVLDIGEGLEHFDFVVETNAKYADTKTFYKTRPASFEQEVSRIKVNRFQKLRRLIPLPNFRFRWEKSGDLLFTYGCLLFTNKPYCVWIENGAALHAYDPKILQNPFAKIFLIPFALDPHLRNLIFMSQAAEKSFFATLGLKDGWLKRKLQSKSIQLYPKFPEPPHRKNKVYNGEIRCLFTGVYYIKGGRETLNAFRELRKKHTNIFLTVLTPLHMLHENDRTLLEETEGVTLLDATLQRSEMEELYKTHNAFLFPSYKDTFGLVLIEALSFGFPIIATDQYAVTEMVQHEYNGFVLADHPFTDYDRQTFFMRGKYYDIRLFYQSLFALQKQGKTEVLKDFITESILRYLENPELIEQHSKNSYTLYDQQFKESIIRKKWGDMFLNSLNHPSKNI